MAVRRVVDPEQSRRFARAPVVGGRILGVSQVVSTEALRDDLGRQLAGNVFGNGAVELTEPTGRRVFWTGWGI
jgi:hypothetical protein